MGCSPLTEREICAVVREVTDTEVEHYAEFGWVFMPRLVAPEFAAELLRVKEQLEQERGEPPGRRGGVAREGVEPHRSFIFSQRMEQNAKRLIDQKRLKGADIALRYRVDTLNVRVPGQAGARYHQDSAEHGSDRVGELQFWLALAEVTPEMGAMRFFDRSHKEGPLGAVLNGALDEHGEPLLDLLDQYPNLPSVLSLSDPLHYQPGDVTVHHGYCIHGSPANSTECIRHSYLFSFTPADTRYFVPADSTTGSGGNHGSGRQQLGDESNPLLSRHGREARL